MEEYARKYGAHDLDRLGLFIEMPYLLPEKKAPKPKEKKKAKTTPFIGSCTKTKCGNQDGYFDNEFKRAFEGDSKKIKKKEPKGKKSAQLPFTPVGPGKKQSSPGDYYGCFVVEPPKAFSAPAGAAKKGKGKKKEAVKPNPMTNPGKKGGPGVADITINPYPEHIGEPPAKPKKKDAKAKDKLAPFYSGGYPDVFDPNPFVDEIKKPVYVPPKLPKEPKHPKLVFVPTGPGKLSGGCYDGGFDHWPEHVKDPYLTPIQIRKFWEKGKKGAAPKKPAVFVPPSLDIRLMYTSPVLANVRTEVNNMTWKTSAPKYVEFL